MNYPAPDGWQFPQFPAHGSHHAAPSARPAPMRLHAHRALRLAGVAGAWAAGLCLVIGSVALVAETTQPTSTTHVSTAAGVRRLGNGKPAGHAARSGPLTRTFRGTGNRTTGQFTEAARHRWNLRWSYACPAGRPSGGRLLIREGGAGGTGVSVSAFGPAGAGSTWIYSRAAAHYLVVITNCAWTIKVTGSR
ncbi:MAG TPA: hypothetical protein VFX25_17920 [Streptosporangiaceae bacterium]|nr:hypothetical protein [Streptosporangiaceae bacterium]